MQLTTEEKQILNHALGVYDLESSKSRNYYILNPSDKNKDIIEILCDRGLMAVKSGSYIFGWVTVYYVTDKGKEVLGV